MSRSNNSRGAWEDDDDDDAAAGQPPTRGGTGLQSQASASATPSNADNKALRGAGKEAMTPGATVVVVGDPVEPPKGEREPPKTKPYMYRVKDDEETLADISALFDVPVDDIIDANAEALKPPGWTQPEPAGAPTKGLGNAVLLVPVPDEGCCAACCRGFGAVLWGFALVILYLIGFVLALVFAVLHIVFRVIHTLFDVLGQCRKAEADLHADYFDSDDEADDATDNAGIAQRNAAEQERQVAEARRRHVGGSQPSQAELAASRRVEAHDSALAAKQARESKVKHTRFLTCGCALRSVLTFFGMLFVSITFMMYAFAQATLLGACAITAAMFPSTGKTMMNLSRDFQQRNNLLVSKPDELEPEPVDAAATTTADGQLRQNPSLGAAGQQQSSTVRR